MLQQHTAEVALSGTAPPAGGRIAWPPLDGSEALHGGYSAGWTLRSLGIKQGFGTQAAIHGSKVQSATQFGSHTAQQI